MAITADNFNKVVVALTSNIPFPGEIYAYQDDVQVGFIPHFNGKRGHYDVTEQIYVWVRDRIYEGNATHEYRIDRVDYVTKSDIPEYLRFNLDKDPLQASLVALATVPPDVYGDKVFYKYETIPDGGVGLAQPSQLPFTGDIEALIMSMGAFGWYIDPVLANTNKDEGDETLYNLLVHFNYNGMTNMGSAHATTATTDAVQYSIDFGQTWNTVPPADWSTVTTTRVNEGGVWVEHHLQLETEEEIIPGQRFVSGNFWAPWQSSAVPSAVSTIDNVETLIRSIQVKAIRPKSWSNTGQPKYGFYTTPIYTSEIVYVRPHLHGWGDVDSGYDSLIEGDAGLLALIVQKSTGHMWFGYTDRDDQASIYDGSVYTILWCGFESYPKSEVEAPISAGASDLGLDMLGTPYGIAVGDTVFCEDEQMRVTSIGSPTTYSEGGVVQHVYTELRVERGINGTTRAGHAIGATIRVMVNQDRLRRFTVYKVSGVSAPFKLQLIGTDKPTRVVEV